MYKIYINQDCLLICDGSEYLDLFSGEEVVTSVLDGLAIKSKGRMFVIKTDDIDAKIQAINAKFKEVDAAGGLVKNANGDFLLIKRWDKWDLPKGHSEQFDDSFEETALREVREETGIKKMQIKKFICATHHCYQKDELWHLKHTYWYEMYCKEENEKLMAQEEEGISQVIWVKEKDLNSHLSNTYPSILDVFCRIDSKCFSHCFNEIYL